MFPRLAILAALSLTLPLALPVHALSPAPSDPNWSKPPFGGKAADLRQAFQRSCDKFARKPAASALSSDSIFGTYGQWQSICEEALALPANKLENYLSTRLTKVERQAEKSKFTGYYQPILEGSRTRHGPYQIPLVAKPKDLVRCNGKTGQQQANGTCTTPYPSRAEIETALNNGSSNYNAFMWLKDPVDAYFLQIQGSGTVELDDGSLAYVGFAGKNGHPYVAIGKTMKERGYLTGDITADKIRTWLAKATPEQAQSIYHSNPSFIFFRESKQPAMGAFGVPLVPGRSLAVDKSHLPLGVPVFIETHLTHENKAWNRIMFAHDVGSAINGPVRGDIFFGLGPLAAARAGDQNESGRLYVMVPKENVPPLLSENNAEAAAIEPSAGPTPEVK